MAVKEEILEGLKVAISRGEPLRDAMMSFYNAGYSKQDVEDSARALQAPQIPGQYQTPPPQQIQTQSPTQPQTKLQTQIPPQGQQQIIPPQIQQPLNVQRVSGYEKKPKLLGNTLIYILVFFLVLLIGLLASLFLFREEITSFFNNLIG